MDKAFQIADITVHLCNNVLFPPENGDTKDMPKLTAEMWDEVLAFAARQGVLPLLVHSYAKCKVTDAKVRQVLVRWFVPAQGNHQRYQIRLQTMREMARLFSEEGIDIMFFKGASLAQLYPEPGLRVFSDIDYYLYGKSSQGIDALAGIGVDNQAYYHHHTQAEMNGVLLENHYDFVERVNHRCDILLDDALKNLAAEEGRSVRADFLGDDITNAYTMTPTMNAIFLMRHMSGHFVGETIPLRQLYDWALFLQQYAKDVNWTQVLELYAAAGMREFAGIVQELLHEYLGETFTECPIQPLKGKNTKRVWESIITPPQQDPYKKFSLRYYIFEAGTFFSNRWKHRIVYPDESYFLLFLRYTGLAIRKMLGLLKIG